MRRKSVSERGIAVILTVTIALAGVITPAFVAVGGRLSSAITIVLDAGHGGADGGVVGTKTGVKESEINLYMSKIVGEYLEGMGFKVVQTRKNSAALSGGVFKKRTDMDERVRIIEKAKPAAVVSLHMNTYSSPARRGAQVFYYAKSEESKNLATVIQSGLNEKFNLADTGREYSALTAEKYLFWKVSAPIVIVECGFLSNPTDERNFSDDGYRHEFGQTIAECIARYVYSKEQ